MQAVKWHAYILRTNTRVGKTDPIQYDKKSILTLKIYREAFS